MTRRILSLAVALLLALSACAAIAEDIYPMQDRPTLTLWTTVDADISLFGYSSYNDTPGFKAWQEATGINVKVTEAGSPAHSARAVWAQRRAPAVWELEGPIMMGPRTSKADICVMGSSR